MIAARWLAVVAGSLVFCILDGCARPAAQRTLALGQIMQVSPEDNGEDVNQIWPAADPSDSLHLIACGMDQYPRQNVNTGYVYASADGGQTWQRTMFERGTKWVSEEACTYAADGRAYFVAGESDTSTGEPRHEWGHLHIFASDDRGMTWKQTWVRKDGWIDWTSLAAAPAAHGTPASLVVFGNAGTDRLGHWWSFRPVAMASRDAARSFSSLLTPPAPAGLSYFTVWTSGSTMLPDGTALFASSVSLARQNSRPSEWWNGLLRVETFAYSPTTRTVSSRAVVRTEKNAGIFTVTMARDTGRGPFGGHLYMAWIETNPKRQGIGTLWLGTSTDGGYRWSTRPISSRSGCVGDIKVATAPDGTIGLVWSELSKEIEFAFSRDGGRTFSGSSVVAYHEPGALAASDAVANNEYWAAESQQVSLGKSLAAYTDLTHLGVSIRVNEPQGMTDYAIVASADDLFHTLWTQVRPDGTHGIFTRTIRVSSRMARTSPLLSIASPQCAASDMHQLVPEPQASPVVRAVGQKDVSQSFFLRLQNLNYDSAARVVSADVVLMNKGTTAIRGPLALYGLELHSDYGDITPINASGVSNGQPFWNASDVIPANGLAPGASSKPLTLRFKITNFRQLENGGRGGDGSAMLVRIYQRQ